MIMTNATVMIDVFSVDYAESFNQKVRETLKGNLFMFCNYSPRHEKSFSEKDRLYSVINNLYRLTADSGFVLRCVKIILTKADLIRVGKLSDCSDNILRIISNIKTVRTFMVHNLAVENGFFDEKVLQNFDIITGRMRLETEEDYKKLNVLVSKWIESLTENIDKLLDEISKLKERQKDRLIKEWEKQILIHYAKPFTGIYMGRLAHLYYSKLEENSAFFVSTDDIYAKTKCWIKHYFSEKVTRLDKQVDDLQLEIKELENPDSNIPENILKKIETKRQAILKEKKVLLQEKEQALTEAKQNDNLNTDDSFYRFFDNLYEQLCVIQKDNPDISLLPQNILQKHVDKYFGDLSIP